MTVGELIEELKDLPEHLPVTVVGDASWGYGPLHEVLVKENQVTLAGWFEDEA